MAVIKNKRLVPLLLLAAAVAINIFSSASCGARKNYKVLKVFFDGVPNPDEPRGINTANTASANTANVKRKSAKKQREWVKMVSRHPDYYKNICNNCHDRSSSNFLRVEKKEDLCFSCHKPAKFTGAYIHGPVAVKKCLICHLPHESRYKHLLREKPEQLCADCHIQKTVPIGKTKTGESLPPDACDKGKDCTTCHYGHAADNPYFLRKR